MLVRVFSTCSALLQFLDFFFAGNALVYLIFLESKWVNLETELFDL
jgi:hypothetical protein